MHLDEYSAYVDWLDRIICEIEKLDFEQFVAVFQIVSRTADDAWCHDVKQVYLTILLHCTPSYFDILLVASAKKTWPFA